MFVQNMLCRLCAVVLPVFISVKAVLPNGTDVSLNNGVVMPVISLGTAEYQGTRLETLIETAVKTGFRGIDAAFNYYNQDAVRKGLHKVNRSELFIITKTTPCVHPQAPPRYNILDHEKCAAQTKKDVESNFEQLGVKIIDLLLLHGPNQHTPSPCDKQACGLNSVQWAVYEDYLKSGRVRAIGVSNYCPSCLQCILASNRVVPAVNQIKYHAGMTADPESCASFGERHGIVTMAYSPLAGVIGDSFLQDIADKHNKSTAQIGLKWIQSKGYTLATASDNAAHLKEDLDLFSWELSKDEVAKIDAYTKGTDKPSWGCSDAPGAIFF